MLCALYLRLKGYRILERRYRSSYGEIDLIVCRGRTLVFVEVKQRQSASAGLEPVTARSEERIVRTGEVFLSRHPDFVKRDFVLRYDLIVVSERVLIDHRKDVFRGW